ncbi:MAG TPA: hypothetical protein VE130_05185 [Nitrososphaeraceae archaeon]|nr:hypothetical protein [Nitrososphaeraceae archaeon]
MTKNIIKVSSALVASLLVLAVLANTVELSNAQENQTEVQESVRLQKYI